MTEFGLHSPELRRHRQLLRAAADLLAKNTTPAGSSALAGHAAHAGILRPRSKRPLLGKLDSAVLPPINISGVTALPWSVLAETTVDRQFKPAFAKYLQELDGKQVSLTGFMQPLGEDAELGSFMFVEYPIGCWYCEMPEITGIVLVELPASKTATFTRGQVKITGKLSLNASDPENFLYTVRNANVAEAD